MSALWKMNFFVEKQHEIHFELPTAVIWVMWFSILVWALGPLCCSLPPLQCWRAPAPLLHPYRFDKLNLRTTPETSGLVQTTLRTQSNCSGSAVLHSPPRPADIIPSSHIESSLPHLTWAAAFYYYQFVSISGSKSIFCDTFWHHWGSPVQSSLENT